MLRNGYRIESERQSLRPLAPDDVDSLVALNADPEVRRYVDELVAPSREETAARMPRLLERYGRADEPAFWASEHLPEYQQVISVKYLTLQDGVESEEAREFMESEYLQVYSELPGFNAKVGQPEPTRAGHAERISQ